MTSAVINCNITTMDADDRRAAKKAIADSNALGTNLPSSTAAEIKSSYETLLMAYAMQRHQALVTLATEQASAASTGLQSLKGPMADATPAKQAAALAAALAALA